MSDNDIININKILEKYKFKRKKMSVVVNES
jgi:hypothetical protein